MLPKILIPSRPGSMKTSSNKPRVPRLGGTLFIFCGIGLLLVLIAYPLACLLIQMVLPNLFAEKMNLAPSLKPLIAVFTDKTTFLAVQNSVFISLCGTLLALVIGTLSAFTTESFHGRIKKIGDGLVWLIFFLPSYVIAQGWVVCMQDGGLLSQLFHLPTGWSAFFFTRFGIVLIFGLSFFPFVHITLKQGIRNLNRTLVNAARVSGAGRTQTMFRIILPLLTPAWLAGGSIVFAEAFGDFGVAAAITPLSHIPLVPYQIYAAMDQQPVNYPAAAGLSFLVIVISACSIALQFAFTRKRAFETVAVGRQDLFRPNRTASASFWVIAGIAIGAPLGSTLVVSLWKVWTKGPVMGNWTLAYYTKALVPGGVSTNALGISLQYALITAAVTMVLGVLFAFQFTFQRSRLNTVLNFVTMSTIAVPGIVMGASFIFAWNAVWLIPINLVLYGTPVCLAMAYLATYIPYAIRIQAGAMRQIPPNLLNAALVSGANRFVMLQRIVFPMVAGTAISTLFMTVTKVIFELPAASLLYPAGDPPFSVIVEHYFSDFNWPQGSANAIVGVLFIILIYLVGQGVLSFFRKKMTSKPAVERQPAHRQLLNETKEVSS